MKTRVAASLLVVLLAASALAQTQPPQPPQPPHPPDLGKWWKNSEVAAALALTATQVKQIEQAFLEHRLKLIDLRADLEREETKLQPLIEADQPDEAQVSAQIDQVLAARGRLEKANAMMMLSIRRVLTVDQWRKLEALKQARTPRPPMPPALVAPPGQPLLPHPPRAPRAPRAPRPEPSPPPDEVTPRPQGTPPGEAPPL